MSTHLTRRNWLTTAAGFLAASACAPKKGTGYPGYALVATAGLKSVSAVDLTAFQLAATIPVPGTPRTILSVPHGGAFVLLPDAGSIGYIGPDLKLQRSKRVATRLSNLHGAPDGKHLIAVDPDSRQLLILDAQTLAISSRQRLADSPLSVAVSETGELVACAAKDDSLTLIHLGTGAVARSRLQAPVATIRFRSDGKLLLATNPDEKIVTALSVPGLAVLAELPLGMEPRNLCFTPDGGQLFVSGPGMDAVAVVFPYNTLEVEQTVLVGRDPGAMACSDEFLFVGSASGTDVSIMRVDIRKPVGAVDIRSVPTFLTLTPDGQYALVLSRDGGQLAVIRVGAIKATRSKTGVALFTMLPVGDQPVHCGFVTRQPG